MKIEYRKYHGCGNDFLLVATVDNIDYALLAPKICHRRLGVGADGLIVYKKDPPTMYFYNSDGSAGTMCGNGLRCLARFFFDAGIIKSDNFAVRTPAGIKEAVILDRDIAINLGKAVFAGAEFKSNAVTNDFIDRELSGFVVSAVFTGACHLVAYVNDLTAPSTSQATRLSNHPLFPDRINVNFARVIDGENIEVRTYERGVGWTAACGTGAAAVYAISLLKGLCRETITVRFKYGIVKITADAAGNILLIGPATKIASGFFYY